MKQEPAAVEGSAAAWVAVGVSTANIRSGFLCKARKRLVKQLNNNSNGKGIVPDILYPVPGMSLEENFQCHVASLRVMPPPILSPLQKGIKRGVWGGAQTMCFGHYNCQLKFKRIDFKYQEAYAI